MSVITLYIIFDADMKSLTRMQVHVELFSELRGEGTARSAHKLMHRFKESDVERLMDEIGRERE